jgi:hypothetical protein
MLENNKDADDIVSHSLRSKVPTSWLNTSQVGIHRQKLETYSWMFMGSIQMPFAEHLIPFRI